ncbi:MAG TPA: Rap1a/Tai family immunity protein [Rhodanobacteraceae bacterium]|nr:Rap1a/Tai family immunity protein [Rhodanobacteraceae bacterium]
MKTFVVAFLCTLAVAPSAVAQDKQSTMTAGDLAGLCSASDAESKLVCHSYILGVTDGIQLGMSIADGKTNGGRPCIPANLSGSALDLAVKEKLGADLMVYPTDKQLGAAGVIGAMLVTTFPCQQPR